ncbi:MAG: efflux RND transporter periplasmic adaptor subunit [Syntrophales bacterium]|nr:efflux RND transporter periplasmic adaptor subunit [Syntrophales bacterium]MDY0045608.1 efflux RND transporter periplasmic adaptor subunit [Syntrophales bacterium]
MKSRWIGIILIIALISAALFVYSGQWRRNRDAVYYSGIFEATQAALSFQIAGKAQCIHVREGQTVTGGQLLAELDSREFTALYNQAAANFDQARSLYDQRVAVLELYSLTLPAEVERAESAARSALFHLAELEAGTRVQNIEQARQAMLAARSVMEDAQKNAGRYEALYQKGIVSEKERDSLVLGYKTSLREYERSRKAYDLAKEGSRTETIQAARARLDEAQAAVKESQSNLKRLDALREDVEAGKAQIRLAEAALEKAKINLEYTQLKAPFSGRITSRSLEPGEYAVPGQEILRLSDLSRMDLKIFVDETRIGTVKPEQKAEVRVDSFPDKIFYGSVSFISQEAEFTPKFIQTHKERVKLVYLVEISIPNPESLLKPGMPADAWLK